MRTSNLVRARENKIFVAWIRSLRSIVAQRRTICREGTTDREKWNNLNTVVIAQNENRSFGGKLTVVFLREADENTVYIILKYTMITYCERTYYLLLLA